MKENRKREILIFAVVLSVSLIAVLLINNSKPFAIFGSDGQAKQVTNAFWQQQATQATPNPDENVTLSTDTSLSAELQLTNTNQASDSKTATDLPSGTQSPSVNTSGTASASSGTANILPLSATPTPANRATQTNQPGSTPTATRQPTNVPLPSPSLTSSPTLQTGWKGDWTFYLDNGYGQDLTGTLNITLSGQEVLAAAVIDGSSYEFVGQLSADRTSIMGDYTSGTNTGWFYWVFISDSQFGGMLDNRYAFCASRNGAEKPGQCGYFVIS